MRLEEKSAPVAMSPVLESLSCPFCSPLWRLVASSASAAPSGPSCSHQFPPSSALQQRPTWLYLDSVRPLVPPLSRRHGTEHLGGACCGLAPRSLHHDRRHWNSSLPSPNHLDLFPIPPTLDSRNGQVDEALVEISRMAEVDVDPVAHRLLQDFLDFPPFSFLYLWCSTGFLTIVVELQHAGHVGARGFAFTDISQRLAFLADSICPGLGSLCEDPASRAVVSRRGHVVPGHAGGRRATNCRLADNEMRDGLTRTDL